MTICVHWYSKVNLSFKIFLEYISIVSPPGFLKTDLLVDISGM